ncbi:MAG: flagellar hook-length control protein FliK [Vicinamibacterales bacterium]
MLSTDVGAAPAASTLQEGAPFTGASRRESGATQDDFAAMFDRCAGEATPDTTVKTPGRGRARSADPLSGVPAPQAAEPVADTPSAGEPSLAGAVSGFVSGTSVDDPDADAGATDDAPVAAFDPRFFVPLPVALPQPVQDQAGAAQTGDAAGVSDSSSASGTGYEQVSLASRMPMHARGPFAAFQGLTPRPTMPVPVQPIDGAMPPAIDDPIEPGLEDESSSVVPGAFTRQVSTPSLALTADEQRAVAAAVEQVKAVDTASPQSRSQDLPAPTPKAGAVTTDARAVAMASIAAALASDGSGTNQAAQAQAQTQTQTQTRTLTPVPASQVVPDVVLPPAAPVSDPQPAAAATPIDSVDVPAGLDKAITAAPPQAAPGLQRAAAHAAKPAGAPVAIQAEAPPAPASGTGAGDATSSRVAEPLPTEPVASTAAAEPTGSPSEARRAPAAGKPSVAVTGEGAVATDTNAPAGATHARARTAPQDVAVPSAAPRPSARVAHAIAAFQAAANAAASTPATAAQTALAPGTVPAALLDQELPTQIVQAIRVQFDNGSGAAHVRLNPGFLGGMRVGVEVDGNSVVASLEATSADVREWIQRNEPVLRQALADQGLHLARLVIIDDDSRPASDDERGTGEQSQQQQREPSKRSRRPETEGTFEIEL